MMTLDDYFDRIPEATQKWMSDKLPRMVEAFARQALLFGGSTDVPDTIAKCPECGGNLAARSMQWDAASGQPDASALDIDCQDALSHCDSHRWHQSEWQPVRDAIVKWCGAKQLT
jgi:hypothetical protein